MNTERIDFISSYCDRWCERCAFTNRCSTFACTIAVAMCGDVAAGIELAVGAPHPPPGAPRETTGGEWLLEFPNLESPAEEMADYRRDEKARRVRLERVAVNVMATAYMQRSSAWLEQHREGDAASADPILREALDSLARSCTARSTAATAPGMTRTNVRPSSAERLEWVGEGRADFARTLRVGMAPHRRCHRRQQCA